PGRLHAGVSAVDAQERDTVVGQVGGRRGEHRSLPATGSAPRAPYRYHDDLAGEVGQGDLVTVQGRPADRVGLDAVDDPGDGDLAVAGHEALVTGTEQIRLAAGDTTDGEQGGGHAEEPFHETGLSSSPAPPAEKG